MVTAGWALAVPGTCVPPYLLHRPIAVVSQPSSGGRLPTKRGSWSDAGR